MPRHSPGSPHQYVSTTFPPNVSTAATAPTRTRLHAPPRPLAAGHSVCAGPPEASILLRLPAAKNPMKRLSGDQNGKDAPSVPASGWGVLESSFRTQSWVLPEESAAVKPRRRPSGETAMAPNVVFSGG